MKQAPPTRAPPTAPPAAEPAVTATCTWRACHRHRRGRRPPAPAVAQAHTGATQNQLAARR
eukprot:scaffold6093_cov101-Isochrysis_galbana.AAC.1